MNVRSIQGVPAFELAMDLPTDVARIGIVCRCVELAPLDWGVSVFVSRNDRAPLDADAPAIAVLLYREDRRGSKMHGTVVRSAGGLAPTNIHAIAVTMPRAIEQHREETRR